MLRDPKLPEHKSLYPLKYHVHLAFLPFLQLLLLLSSPLNQRRLILLLKYLLLPLHPIL
ncbi:PTS mannose transporter subunit IIAB [Listeria monocytogenes]|nr:PTS mannose transporter subunit IIAB [Listeria monocytogenes]